MVSNPFQDGISVEIGSDVSGLTSGIDTAIGKLDTFRADIAKTGAALAGLGAAGAAGIGKTIDQATDIETALAEVETITDDAAHASDVYGDSVRDLSEEFAAHGGQTEVVEGLYQTLSAGIEEGAEATEFLEQAMQFATAGLTDTETAVDGLSSVLNAYGMEAEDAEDVSDIMFKTVEEGKITAEEFASTVGDIVPIASDAGIAFDEIGGAMATLTAQGINADRASTQIRRTIQELTDPTEEAAALIESLGFESGRAMLEQEGLQGTMEMLTKAADEQGLQMDDLFSRTQAVQGGLALAAQEGDVFAENMDAMGESAGATDEAFETMSETTEFQLRQAMNRLRNVTTELGFSFLSELMPAIQATVDAIERASDWFHNLDDDMRSLIARATIAGTALAGVTGSAMLLIAALPSMAAGLGTATTAFTAIGSAILAVNPVLLAAAAAVALLGGAFVTNFADVRTVTLDVLGTLRSEVEETASVFHDVFGPIVSDVLEPFEDAFEGVGESVESAVADIVRWVGDVLISGIESAGQRIRSTLRNIEGWWDVHGDAVVSSIESALSTARSVYETGMAAISGVVSTLVSVISGIVSRIEGVWNAHGAAITSAVVGAYQTLRSAVVGAVSTLASLVSAAVSRIEAVWDAHGQTVMRVVSAVVGAIVGMYITRIQVLRNIVSDAISVVTGLWESHKGVVIAAAAAIGGAITTLVAKFTGLNVAFQSVIKLAVTVGARMLGLLGPIGLIVAAVVTAYQAWTNNWFGIRDAVQSAIDSIKEALSGGEEAIGSWRETLNGLLATAQRVFGALRSVVAGVASFIMSTFINPLIEELGRVAEAHSDFFTEVKQTLDALRSYTETVLSAVVTFWNQWGDEIKLVVTVLAEVLVGIIGTMLDGILTAIRVGMALIRGDWEQAWTLIKEFAQRTLDGIVNFVATWGTRLVVAIAGALADVLKAFINWGKQLIFGSIVKDIFNAIVDFVGEKLGELPGVIATKLGEAKTKVSTKLGEIKTEFTTKLGEIQTTVVTKLGALKAAITTKFETIRTVVAAKIDAVKTKVTTTLTTIQTTAVTKLGALKAVFTTKFEAVRTVVETKFGEIKTAITTKLSEIQTTVVTKLGALKAAITTKFEAIKSVVTDKVETLKTEVMDKFQKLKDDVTEKATTIKDDVKDSFNTLKEKSIEKVETLKTEVTDKFQELKDDAVEKATTIKDKVTEKFETLKTQVTDKVQETKDDVVDKFGQMKDDALEKVQQLIDDAVSKIQSWSLPSEVKSKAESAVDKFESAFDLASKVDSAISAAQSKIDSWTPDWPSLDPPSPGGGGSGGIGGSDDDGGSGVDSGNGGIVGAAAHGGIVTDPTQLLVGEAGDNEAVIPLNRQGERFFADAVSGAMGGEGGTVNNIDIDVHTDGDADGSQIGQDIVRELESANF